MGGDDAVDEENVALICAACCCNCGLYQDADCIGCSGKTGCFCLNCEVCCKPSAPCLPCCCCGPKVECDGLSCCNVQLQLCCTAMTAAFPCSSEVKLAITLCGLTLFPTCGCCVKVGDLDDKGDKKVKEDRV